MTSEAIPRKPATSKPRMMTDDELAAGKAKIDARNRKRAEESAAKKTTSSRPFRPTLPDEAEATA